MRELKLYQKDFQTGIITVRSDMVAFVDDDRYDDVNNYLWYPWKNNNTYYIRALIPKISRKTVTTLHHYIIGFPLLGYVVDHTDGKGWNNVLSNLRIVTTRQNGHNRRENKTSCYPGVSFHKSRGNYRATISINGKLKHLGSFDDQEEAFALYKATVECLGDRVLDY